MGQGDHRLEKLYEALKTGELSLSDLAPRIKHLRSEEGRLIDAQIQAQESSVRNAEASVEIDQVLAQLKDLKGLLDSGSPVQRKQFVSALIRRVTKAGDQISIEYALPVDDGLGAELDSVPRINLFGGAEGMIGRTFSDQLCLD